MLSPLRKSAGRRLREPFGKAGLTVAVIALVFAMLGGAYAATKLNGKQKKEVEKIAKKYAGKDGAPGANGTNGSNGTNGAKGDTGAQGIQGPKGDTGEAGMCSQEEPECSLASGGVLTGVWGTGGKEGGYALAQISLPVRVSPPPTAIGELREVFGSFTVGYQLKDGSVTLYGPYPTITAMIESGNPITAAEEEEEAYKEVCSGNAAAPTAASGFLCIYTKEESAMLTPFNVTLTSKQEAAHEFGVITVWEVSGSKGYVRGSWAVAG